MINKFIVTELRREGSSIFVVSFLDAGRTTSPICGFDDEAQAAKIAEGLNKSVGSLIESTTSALEIATTRLGAVQSVMARHNQVAYPDVPTVMRELRQAVR